MLEDSGVQNSRVDHLSPDSSLDEPPNLGVLSSLVENVRGLQKLRSFAIKSQQRCDRSVESFIAGHFGYTNTLDAKDRKALFKLSADVRVWIEKGGDGKKKPKGVDTVSPSVMKVVLASAESRRTWDVIRGSVEKDMVKAATSLPGYDFVDGVKGFGAKGFAIIVGEAGDLANYAIITRLWKRLGLAVINGERQQKRTDKDLALLHGYNPRRRAEIWTLGDSMFRHQWAAEKDDAPAHPKWPYGQVYLERRQRTTITHPDWSDKHRDSDAKRIMMKRVILDLWKAWRKDVAVEE